MGQPEEVLAACDLAVKFSPDYGFAYDSRGIARAQLGAEYYDLALKDFSYFVNWYATLSDDEKSRHELNDDMVSRRQGWIEELNVGLNPIDEVELQGLIESEGMENKDSANYMYEQDFYIMAFKTLLYFEHYPDAFDALTHYELLADSPAGYLWHIACINGSIRGQAEQVEEACQKAVDVSEDVGKYIDGRGIYRAITGDFAGAIEDFRASIDYLSTQVQDPEKPEYINQNYYQISIPDYQRWIEGLEKEEIPFNNTDLINLFYPYDFYCHEYQ